MNGQPNEVAWTHEESPKAHRILAIDEEIAALERVNPKARIYLSMLIPLIVLLAAFAVVVSDGGAEDGFRVLSIIRPVLLLVAIPSGVYALELFKNRRRRLVLERELDELIAYSERGESKPGRANFGGEPGGVLL